ncbi:MAG: hypothetical protein PVG71_13730, partial [Anaerolineae bacterium]
MPRIIPSLFKLIGDGFVDDAYAADGNHLRWMFDQRLGFPRHAICLERRPGVGTPEGREGLEQKFEEEFVSDPPTTHDRVVRPGVTVSRPGAQFTIAPKGIILDKRPLVLDFTAGAAGDPEAYACWVRLEFRVLVPGGALRALALYDNRGTDEVVDRERRVYQPSLLPKLRLRPDELTVIKEELAHAGEIIKLVRNPDRGPGPPKLRNPVERLLYLALLRVDRSRYEFVTREYLRSILETLKEQRLSPDDLLPRQGVVKVVHVELRAERIDRVAVTGHQARLARVEWVRSEDLIRAAGWKPVACYPIATGDPDYRKLNDQLFAGQPFETLAEKRVLDPLPHGAEPLDDHEVPPSRPPDADELKARYLVPWLERLEPWLAATLAESLALNVHQAEVTIAGEVTEAGQASGEGVPAELREIVDSTSVSGETTLEMRPYSMLLAASCAFPVARLLGLAAIDRPPSGVELWDYRVRGRWDVRDIQAWVDKLQRDHAALKDRLNAASPAQRPDIEARLLETIFEAGVTAEFLRDLLSGAVGGTIELWALKLGVRAINHDLFARPASLSAAFDGLGIPPDDPLEDIEAIARLEWPLRQRARVIFDEEIPMGAALGRGRSGDAGPFSEMLNPVHPDFGVNSAILPAGPEGAPGLPGTAVFHDRHIRDGVDYRYGVSEVDPFGRWSRFAETTFQWDYDVPPPVPVQIEADLDTVGMPPVLQLTVTFLWPTDRRRLDGHSFMIHVRRVPPPPDDPKAWAEWGRCERQAGTGAVFYSFASTFDGGDTHDDMPVEVASRDRTVTDDEGNTYEYREFEVSFAGLDVARDAIDRARVWVGVSSRDDLHGLNSDEVGGPAGAEHILATPPLPPAFPPEPDQATYADAEGMSTYTLEWDGVGNVRYLVYRAGERELATLLQERGVDPHAGPFDYDPEAASNLRAAALKELATLPEARDAFQPRSELVPEPPRDPETGAFLEPVEWPSLPAGGRAFTDELPGQLRTLTVYTTLGRSASGILSEWPDSEDSFVVVEVPHAPEPARPVIARASWQPPEDPPPEVPEAG